MITSVQNQKVKAYTKLQQKKYRDQQKQFIVEGEHLVIEAVKAHVALEILGTETNTRFTNLELVSEAVMKKITATKNPPKIIAICKQQFPTFLSDKVLILENIQDPGNLGTLLRSALAFDFKTIILDQCVDLFNPKVIRATQGALFQLAYFYQDTETFKLNNPKYKILITSVTKTINQTKPEPPYALVLGNEGQGIKPQTMKLSDHRLHIPTTQVESLNVSVAGSILMQALANPSIF